jgi:DNA-directed RNA polymerase subunit K/omega
MAEEVETTDEQTPLEDAPLPEVTAPLITDRFLFVDVAAMRAKQLRRGARARLGEHRDPNKDAPIKPERIAMEEVRRGVVQYEVPEFKPRLADPKL